ncbi:MAG: T9SS type A sorting domain-containing protein [Bacteroidota bacterium]
MNTINFNQKPILTTLSEKINLQANHFKSILVLIVTLFFQYYTYGQTLLECESTINPSELVKDYKIAPGTKSITFTIKGGDGGDAYLRGGTCNRRVRGGSGATVNATFEVGTGIDQLQAGGTLRVFVGQKGGTEQTGCAPSPAAVTGAGGGSSAILYLPPGKSPSAKEWYLLAEAGAGGGAARPVAGIFRVGGRAFAVEGGGSSGGDSGGNVNSSVGPTASGDRVGSGGQIGWLGDRVDGTTMAKSGKGPNTSTSLFELLANSVAVSTGGERNNRLSGGDGFNGGGIQGTGGGGGGGFGAGAAKMNFAGGGGGSFVNSFFKGSNRTKTDGANGGGTESNGTATITTKSPLTAKCQSIIVQIDNTESVSINPQDIDNGSELGCEGSMTLDKSSFNCSNVGANIVKLTVQDANRQATCTAAVLVENKVGPVARCKNHVVQLDANGNATFSASDIDNGSSIACGNVNLSVENTNLSCSDIGTQPIILTVSARNKIATCTAYVTTEANLTPIARCKDHTIQLDANGNGTLSAMDVDNGSSAICGNVSLSVDKTNLTCLDDGIQLVTLTAKVGDRMATCTSNVRVEDQITPIARCKDHTIQLDVNGNGILSTMDVDNGSGAVCGNVSLSIDKTNFACTDIGNNTITLTVSKSPSNKATCTANVKVEDNLAPTLLCGALEVTLDENGTATITTQQLESIATATDNCGIASRSLDQTIFDCSELGTNTVSLTAKDVNGNSSTCNAEVTIVDHKAPEVQCQDLTISLGVNGIAKLTPLQVDNGSKDNCVITSYTLDKTAFTCDNLGDNLVQLTVTDNSENKATCNAILTVELGSDLAEFSTQSIGTTTGTATYDPCSGYYHLTSTPTTSYHSKVGYGEFTYVTLTGDFTFTAELKSLTSNGMGGLMVRESGNANALMAWVGKYGYSMIGGVNLNLGDQVISQRKGRASRTVVLTATRSGDMITFKQGRRTLLKVRMAMGTSIQVGMFLSSSNSSEAKASFNNVSYSTTNNTSAIQISNDNMSPYERAVSVSSSKEGEAKVSPLRGLGGGKNTTLTLKTWPNPSLDFVNIDLKVFVGNEALLNVFDLSGQLMLREDLGMIYQQQHIQDVQTLPPGVYIISLESAGQVAKSRVVIAR